MLSSIGPSRPGRHHRLPWWRATRVLLACTSAIPAAAHTQESWYAAIGGSHVLPVADGQPDDCNRTYRVGMTQRIGRRIAGPGLAVEANTRLGGIAGSTPGCVYFTTPPMPPVDGTWIFAFRPSRLLSTEWLAADLRLRTTLPLGGPLLTLGVGGGNHWQKPINNGTSRRRPYWVAGAGVLLGQGPGWRVGIEGEWQFLRERFHRSRLTYAGGALVNAEPLGHETEWLRTAGMTVSANFAW